MKVVLFCGGLGMRMRTNSLDDIPKPMQPVGPRPLIWHVMRYYAHYGHKEFILCLGHGARHIKDFFLNYSEAVSNDFVLHRGEVRLLSTDIDDWSISFVQTGEDSPIGERLRRVRGHLEGDEMFLANYADVLTDAPLNEMIETFRAADVGASMMLVPPQSSFHCVNIDGQNMVTSIESVDTLPLWENGGYFILRQEIFDHIPPRGDLVTDGCSALAAEGRLLAQPYRGYWQPADTVKERHALEAAYERGQAPWMVWQ